MLDSLKIVISDLHLGKGRYLPDGVPNPFEDFHHDAQLCDLLSHYRQGEGRDGAANVELVINGDFFDFLSVDISGKYPDAMLERDALTATRLICDGHPDVIRALREFAAAPGCSIRYLLGNHDPAILWPAVRSYLDEVVGGPIAFDFDDYSFEDVRIEHGHQREVVHHFDVANFILPAGKMGRREPIINLPFGCFFVTQFLNGLRARRHYIGQVVPFQLYLRWALFNDFWFALWNGIAVILFFVKMRFIRHPTRFSRFTKTLRILREVLSPPRLERIARAVLESSAGVRILIMGHNHQACMRLYPDGKQYINCGTWTAFTSFDPSMLGHHVVLSYTLVSRAPGGPWQVMLKRWLGRSRVEETLYW